jgi:hypothetical protein
MNRLADDDGDKVYFKLKHVSVNDNGNDNTTYHLIVMTLPLSNLKPDTKITIVMQ